MVQPILTEPNHNALDQICYRMRAEDKAEIYAMRPHNNPFLLAWEAYHMVRDNGRGGSLGMAAIR